MLKSHSKLEIEGNFLTLCWATITRTIAIYPNMKGLEGITKILIIIITKINLMIFIEKYKILI